MLENIEDKFMTAAKFSQDVERIAYENNMNYIDAIVHYCETNEIEIESVSKLISKPLKEKLNALLLSRDCICCLPLFERD